MNEKFIYKSVVFFLILFACMNLPAESKEYAYSKHLPDTVFIFGGMYFPPLQYKEKTGYFFDDIRTLCNTAGIDFSIVVRPTKRLFKEMRQGQIDAWLGNKNAFTEEEINWLITPHMKIFIDGYYIDGRAMPIKLKNKANFRNKKIALWLGFKGGIFPWLRDPENGVDFIDVTSHESAFKMLADGRVTYVVDYRGPALEVLKKTNVHHLKTYNLIEVPLWIGIMKHKKGYASLSGKIDKAFINSFYQLKTTQTMIRMNVWDKPNVILSDLKDKYTRRYGIGPDL